MSKYRTRLVISLTENERETLIRMADYEGDLSLAATLRHILVEAARQRNLENYSRKKSSENFCCQFLPLATAEDL
jgi:hypothetical protein